MAGFTSRALKAGFYLTTALGLLGLTHTATAQTTEGNVDGSGEVVVKMNKKARSSVELSGAEMQKGPAGHQPAARHSDPARRVVPDRRSVGQ